MSENDEFNKAIHLDLLGRIVRLEERQDTVMDLNHEFDKELSNLQINLEYIREGLDQTKGGIQKLLWGVLAVLITYVVGFIVTGGLTSVGG